MTSSMLEKDVDQSTTDVLMTLQQPGRKGNNGNNNTADGGGNVEMSQLNHHHQVERPQQRQLHGDNDIGGNAPPHNNTPNDDGDDCADDDNMQEANSEWVTSNNDKSQLTANTISRKEICICILVVLGMILVTTIGVVVGVNRHRSRSERQQQEIPLEFQGRIHYDIARGQWISSYIVPTRPSPTIITDQDELDYIILELSKYDVLAEEVARLPTTVDAVRASAGSSSDDPYLLATQWITLTDTYNGKEHTITRFALAVLYYSLQGDTWHDNTHWLSSTEYYCNWYGIVCCDDDDDDTNRDGATVTASPRASTLCKNGNNYGSIVEIDLFRNNLIGPIPNIIVVFSSLYSLYMSENSITGTIPGTAIGSLSKFGSFYASYNFLTGTVPVELDTNGILNTLYIQANDINGTFPQELCSCPSCSDVLVRFGTDCHKLTCGENCCQRHHDCFFTNNTITTK